MLSVLTIMFNCIQRKSCLPLFYKVNHLSDSLAMTILSSDLELRFLSKLVLGFLSLILTEKQRHLLALQPDEASYLITSLSHSIENSEDSCEGYSTTELLRGLLIFSEIENNLLICLDSKILKIFNSLLECDKLSCNLILQIFWNILLSANEQAIKSRSSLLNFIPAIERLSDISELKSLQQSILFVIQQEATINGMSICSN